MERNKQVTKMWINKVLIYATLLLLGENLVGSANGQNATGNQIANKLMTQLAKPTATTPASVTEALETAPSITSLHQVWTSASSRSLDELSPEMISKLRSDVPFLAAYALRPRLVGAVPTTLAPPTSANEMKLDTLSSERTATVASDVKGVGRAKSGRQVVAPSAGSLVPKLGDFSEFNVETSSTSKSEHHHQRKTSLKRPQRPAAANGGEKNGLRRRQATLNDSNQPLKKKQARAQGTKRHQALGTRTRRGRERGNLRRRIKTSNRLRRNKMSSSKKGRNLEAGKPNSNELDVEMRELGRDTPTLTGDVSGVKGGGQEGPKKTPFYATKRMQDSDTDEDDTRPSLAADDEASLSRGRERGNSNESVAGEDDGQQAGDLDDDEPEPKRVGDADVEEDGDTVLVEPKSDGVDDDPPLPTDQNNEELSPDEQDGVDDAQPKVAAEGDPRGNRVDREKPNALPGSQDGSGDADGPSDGAGQVAGGGIGGTIGGTNGRDADGTNGNDDSKSPNGSSPGDLDGDNGRREPPLNESGVEFADDGNRDTSIATTTGRSKEDDGPTTRQPAAESSDGSGDGDFGERRRMSTARPRSRSDSGPELTDDEDLDYRDEMVESNRGGAKKPTSNSPLPDEEDDKHERKEDDLPNGKKEVGMHHQSGKEGHCEDGSYDHHADHHADHHGHHDTIDWLRGAIPGEPDDDYPILSRVNVSNFKCADQKHAGYYADVESRCQADGRQDSFL